MGNLTFPVFSLFVALFLSFLPSATSIACSTYKPAITGITLTTAIPGDCVASQSSDFTSRDTWAANGNGFSNCTIADTWGPWPKLYEKATIPSNCSSVTWQQQRVVKAADWLIKKGWNYCHHHSPYWLPPQTDPNVSGLRTGISISSVASTTSTGVCSSAAWPNGVADSTQDAHWTGLDCTHFTSYVYNFAFGAFLHTNTDHQACSTSNPGKILPYNADQADKFLPGDLLYIGSSSTANPMAISHGVVWTGYKMDDPAYPQFSQANLVANMPSTQLNSTLKWIKQNANKTVYVIADSHNIGPNYRPFCRLVLHSILSCKKSDQSPCIRQFPFRQNYVVY